MDEAKLKSAHVHNWDDQKWDSNSWWINHTLGDILFSIQLLITHMVTTFSVEDNHDILGIYLVCSAKQKEQKEHYRDYHRHKMSRSSETKSLTKCHLSCDWTTDCLSLTSDHHSRARDADMILYQTEFVMTKSVTLCRNDHKSVSQKKSWHNDWPSNGRTKCHEACIGHTNRFEWSLLIITIE